MPKAESAFSRANAVYDTTIGWRFVNTLMKEQYGVDSMPETAENVADRLQDRARGPGPDGAGEPAEGGRGAEVGLLRRRDRAGHRSRRRRASRSSSTKDEHPRETSLEALAKLKGVVRPDGTRDRRQRVRRQRRRLRAADRRAKAAAAKHGLTPRARIVGMATAGVAPRIMGIGPAPATPQGARS